MDDKINIFFFDFFLELRKLGIELDLNQFQDFIQMLSTSEHISKGISVTEKKKALLLLCKTLWLTKIDHKDKFEELFEKAFSRAAKEGEFFVDESSVNKNKKEKEEAEARAKAAREAKAKAEIEAKKKELDSKFNEAEEITEPESSEGEDEEPLKVESDDKIIEEEECNVFLNFREGAGDATVVEEIKEKSKKKSSFIFSDEKHLPFSTRKGKQIWRKLQYESTATSLSTEIDVKTSIEKFAKEMLLHELDYKKEKKNSREMILLVDHSGAMVAFESWIEQLKDILRGSIAGKKLSTYYFYNVPLPVENKYGTDYKVFNSTLHLQPKLISEMVSKMSKNTDIVIFSDAGVFENIKDYEKAGVFFAVYSLLKRRTSKILWVNPFAEERWTGNTAEMIASLIPMIGYNLDEMKRGVKILKG